MNATKNWLINGAVRYENYSDFGSTVIFKLASLLKINDNINWRISGQTGFRAPSLQQKYFESSSTQFINGSPYQVGYFTNDSQAAKSIGVESLKPEKSKSISTGDQTKPRRLKLLYSNKEAAKRAVDREWRRMDPQAD